VTEHQSIPADQVPIHLHIAAFSQRSFVFASSKVINVSLDILKVINVSLDTDSHQLIAGYIEGHQLII
jgi:hypothetical protein